MSAVRIKASMYTALKGVVVIGCVVGAVLLSSIAMKVALSVVGLLYLVSVFKDLKLFVQMRGRYDTAFLCEQHKGFKWKYALNIAMTVAETATVITLAVVVSGLMLKIGLGIGAGALLLYCLGCCRDLNDHWHETDQWWQNKGRWSDFRADIKRLDSDDDDGLKRFDLCLERSREHTKTAGNSVGSRKHTLGKTFRLR